MGDAPPAAEDWAGYLRRMTDRDGWSVARLARESGIHRGTIFKWMAGKSGVTVASVRAVAQALGDDPNNALRAAAGSVIEEPARDVDEEERVIIDNPTLPPEMKVQIIKIMRERRERERLERMADAQRMIGLMGGTP